MFDFLLDGGLLLGMAGLLMAISLIAGRLSNSMISRAESADAQRPLTFTGNIWSRPILIAAGKSFTNCVREIKWTIIIPLDSSVRQAILGCQNEALHFSVLYWPPHWSVRRSNGHLPLLPSKR